MPNPIGNKGDGFANKRLAAGEECLSLGLRKGNCMIAFVMWVFAESADDFRWGRTIGIKPERNNDYEGQRIQSEKKRL